ncbi:MAG: sigma 54-interacting transcriptional regulator [Candidatus Zixiibacteriota bacterium]
MNLIPQSQFYEFEELVAENNLTQSWIATKTSTLSKCFVKTLSTNGSLSKSDKMQILNVSFDSQRKLSDRNLLRAVDRHTENGEVFFEYPYLDRSEWKPLSAECLLRHFDSLFPEVCFVLDYIHLMGFIHGDAKLSNYLVKEDATGIHMYLTDLDFLRPANQPLRGKLLGTMRFIAPEVETNDSISPDSDNFSLGRSIEESLSGGEIRNSKSPVKDRLVDLTAKLTQDDPCNRPHIILDAVHECGLIDDSKLQELNRTLLSLRLLTDFRQARVHNSRELNAQKFFVERNKVLGLHEEFLNDVDCAFRKDHLSAFRLLRSLLSESQIDRYVDFWHISTTQQQLISAYSGLNGSDGAKPLLPIPDKPNSTEKLSDLMTSYESLRENKNYLKSYLCLWSAHQMLNDSSVKANDSVKADLAGNLGDLSAVLSKTEDAAVYYEEAVSCCTGSTASRLEYLHRAAYQRIFRREMEGALRLIDDGISDAGQSGNTAFSLEFHRLLTWVSAATGKLDEAEAELNDLMKKAEETNDNLLKLRIYSDLGTLSWRRGDYSKASDNYKISIDTANENGLMDCAVTPLMNLSLLCSEALEYRKSIKYAKLGMKSAVHPVDFTKLLGTYRTVMLCHARMAEYQKSDYWIQKYLSASAQEHGKTLLARFLADDGWLSLQKGETSRAQELLSKSALLFEQIGSERELGKVYQNLAELALYTADSSAYELYSDKAENIFNNLGDRASLNDVLLIRCLYEILYTDHSAAKKLVPIVGLHMELGSYYFAALGLFYLLINEDATAQVNLDQFAPLVESISKSKAPLCRAVKALIVFRQVPESDRTQELQLLKSAYRVLHSAGNTMLALQVSCRIREYYSLAEKEKLARKYLLNAHNLAAKLNNEVLVTRYQDELGTESLERTDKRELLDAIHSISNVFRDLADYDETLQKIVRFAVDLTGAERGVLLLRQQDITDIRVRAYVNCDDDSLRDIVDFSKNVVQNVAESESALVIENALVDRRTKGFKSIIDNNILSVICIPVYDGLKALGVLYLDHHTIPALFSEDDVSFISAMANFLSHVITTAKNFKNANVLTAEYLDELHAEGRKQRFITKNPATLELLKNVQVIAQSDASVLITGESGTGKEIMCERIHSLGARSDQPLVKVNCAAFATGLSETELFGIAKNVASGVDARPGKFAAADGGTLFLDEIGDMPPDIQAKILRVIEYQEFQPVGSNRTINVNIRFIFATNQDLRAKIREGKFREDLYYRMNKFCLEIEPLRKRPEDIQPLIDHFSRQFAKPSIRFSSDAISAMILHDWPGNVRELKNMIEKFSILSPGRRIEKDDLPADIRESSLKKVNRKRLTAALEKTQIEVILKAHDWNKSKASRALGMSETTLRRKMRLYGIERPL